MSNTTSIPQSNTTSIPQSPGPAVRNPIDRAVEMAVADGRLSLSEAAVLRSRGFDDEVVEVFLRERGGRSAVKEWQRAREMMAAIDASYSDGGFNAHEAAHLRDLARQLGYQRTELMTTVRKLHGSDAARELALVGMKCPSAAPAAPVSPLASPGESGVRVQRKIPGILQ
jgi:hypothetical protein